MPRQVTLTRTPQRVEDRSFRDTFTASAGVDMPTEVFVLVREVLDPTTSLRVARFSHVASPTELYQLPINAALVGGNSYRVSSFARPYDTREAADAAWLSIQLAVQALVRALDAGEATAQPETVTITG